METYVTLITPRELAEAVEDAPFDLGDVFIFDCRFDLADPAAGRRRYEQGHIAGAIYAHLDEDLSGPVESGRTGRHPLPERRAFPRFVARHNIAAYDQVVAYDDAGGVFAARLWWLMRSIGRFRVAVLDGGYQAWLERDGTDARRTAAATNGGPALVASMEDVGSGAMCLLDARAADRFHGRNETIDAKAGHIPGAISAPFEGNLGSDGRFLDQAALRQRFETLIGDDERPVACYCGSGVSAAHNVLAMVHAGLTQPALYPGSWSEWITDPANPIET